MGDDLETSLVGSADDTSGDAAGAPTERMVDPQVSPAVPAADDSAERGVATPRRRRRWPIVAPIVVVIVLVVGWVGANAVAAYWIAHNGDTPKLASAPPVGAESVTYAKGRGAWYLAPQPGKPVIVFAHGYQANRGDLVPVARTLHGEGDGALLIDFGYDSGGTYGGGQREADDIKKAIAYVHGRAPGANVVLFGNSAGGTASVLAAAQSSDVAAVVTDSSPVGFIRLATDRIGIPRFVFGLTSTLYPLFSNSGHLKDLKNDVDSAKYKVPTLVIQGTSDGTVDPANAEELARVTHGQLWIVKGAGHTKAFRLDPNAYVAKVDAFLSASVAR